jgi:hypothetical protein
MIKVNYDPITGKINSFYPDYIKYETIPEPTIEITAEQHMDCINNPGLRKVDINFYKIVTCVLPEATTKESLQRIRIKRDSLLAECDWTVLPDSPLTEDEKSEWKKYRQELRNFPETCDPKYPSWPKEPT